MNSMFSHAKKFNQDISK
ncbi:hypothetical protein [Mycoplasma capricolum]